MKSAKLAVQTDPFLVSGTYPHLWDVYSTLKKNCFLYKIPRRNILLWTGFSQCISREINAQNWKAFSIHWKVGFPSIFPDVLFPLYTGNTHNCINYRCSHGAVWTSEPYEKHCWVLVSDAASRCQLSCDGVTLIVMKHTNGVTPVLGRGC